MTEPGMAAPPEGVKAPQPSRAWPPEPARTRPPRVAAPLLLAAFLALLADALTHGAGGGLGILMCSDYAVVGASSTIGSRYANIGLTPDLSVSAQLARAVGERRALTTGDPLALTEVSSLRVGHGSPPSQRQTPSGRPPQP